MPSTGRSGTAYSLFTREELPYLLDLHLFLSRGVQPAPVASLAQAAAAAGGASSDVSLYGTFPQVNRQHLALLELRISDSKWLLE